MFNGLLVERGVQRGGALLPGVWGCPLDSFNIGEGWGGGQSRVAACLWSKG
jgi:hypothetical protein